MKIGRGEYFEALDFIGYLRSTVLGPMLHLKSGNLPGGVRKVEVHHFTATYVAARNGFFQHNKIAT